MPGTPGRPLGAPTAAVEERRVVDHDEQPAGPSDAICLFRAVHPREQSAEGLIDGGLVSAGSVTDPRARVYPESRDRGLSSVGVTLLSWLAELKEPETGDTA